MGGAPAASAAVMPQGAGLSGDRGGLIKGAPAKAQLLWGIHAMQEFNKFQAE